MSEDGLGRRLYEIKVIASDRSVSEDGLGRRRL